jgi:hypothetical protein
MRELTYYVACSVDGFIAHADSSHAGFSQDSEYFADLFSSFPETVPSHLRDVMGIHSEKNGTKLRCSPCPDWFPASGLGTPSERLCLQRIDERQSLSKFVPSPEAGNENTQDFGLILVPFDYYC